MIPVTSFAGKTVAVFGLGGSGLASCHALKAGGAEVIAGDDGADNLAKAAQAGFITAILSLEPPRKGRVHVIEMSSYQIDLTPSLDPYVGILLNISEDHIDRHGSLEHYAAVKARLVTGVQPQGAAI